MVPIPSAPDIETLNATLLERCRDRLTAVLRGAEGASIDARLETDRAAFMELPATAFDARCRQANACIRREGPQAPGPGQQPGFGPLPEHRLLGPGRLRASRYHPSRRLRCNRLPGNGSELTWTRW